jgi:hypothetical protein
LIAYYLDKSLELPKILRNIQCKDDSKGRKKATESPLTGKALESSTPSLSYAKEYDTILHPHYGRGMTIKHVPRNTDFPWVVLFDQASLKTSDDKCLLCEQCHQKPDRIHKRLSTREADEMKQSWIDIASSWC